VSYWLSGSPGRSSVSVKAMTFPVVVVLGAGASLGCASHGPSGNGRDPPLVTDPFDGERRITEVLSQYPRAAAAGAEIRRRTNPRAVEDFIRERFRDSDNAIDQLKFLSIPYYLQELLLRVSRGYTRDPNNYDVLIAGLLRLPTRVLFVTMNYDTLLDDRLHTVAGELERLDGDASIRTPSNYLASGEARQEHVVRRASAAAQS
jgi:hypothetical protein